MFAFFAALSSASTCSTLAACDTACDAGVADACVELAQTYMDDRGGLAVDAEIAAGPLCERGDTDACIAIARAQRIHGHERPWPQWRVLQDACALGEMKACDEVYEHVRRGTVGEFHSKCGDYLALSAISPQSIQKRIRGE